MGNLVIDVDLRYRAQECSQASLLNQHRDPEHNNRKQPIFLPTGLNVHGRVSSGEAGVASEWIKGVWERRAGPLWFRPLIKRRFSLAAAGFSGNALNAACGSLDFTKW